MATATTSEILASRGILVSVTIGLPGFSKQDKEARSVIAEKFSASEDRVKASKSLIDPEAMKGLKAVSSAIRAYVNKNSIPWSEDGIRLIRSTNFDKFIGDLRDLRRQFDDEREIFLKALPDLIIEGKQALGDMGDVDIDPAEIAGKLQVKFSTFQIPTATIHPLAKFTEEGIKSIQESAEESAQRSAEKVVTVVKERIQAVLGHMKEKLLERKLRKSGEGYGIFRDSLITNARELGELIRDLNVFDDPTINEAADKLLTEFGGVDPDLVRENDTVRAEIAEKAESVLESTMSALDGIYGNAA